MSGYLIYERSNIGVTHFKCSELEFGVTNKKPDSWIQEISLAPGELALDLSVLVKIHPRTVRYEGE